MKVMLFGATGMVGRGVLRECLLDPDVEQVLAVGRNPTGVADGKLSEIVRADLFDLSPVVDGLTGYDACFFCLGVSSAGMGEEKYRRLTYDLTLGVARLLADRNPGMTFVYVSGMGTDSTERGRSMWARVKGATENALQRLPLEVYLFRPGYIQPTHGTTSRVWWYRAMYAVVAPLYPVLRRAFPGQVTTTEQIGRAMLAVARHGAAARILGPREINAAASP
jgi:uncharacterized protein YbjT (DUF2867 family)